MKKNKIGIELFLELTKTLRELKNNNTVAVLVDGDNVSLNLVDFALRKIEDEYGVITVRRIYANWSFGEVERWNSYIKENDFIRSNNSSPGEKNSADIALVIDAMDLLHNDEIDIFCIISHDRDFLRLVSHLCESGKYVIGFGLPSQVTEQTQKVYNEYHLFKTEKEDNNLGIEEPNSVHKFESDLSMAYNICHNQTAKVYGTRLFKQYEKIKGAITFRHYNNFRNEIETSKQFSIKKTLLGDLVSRNSNPS